MIAEPFDASRVRMVVIADAQGATFVASRFAPENRDLTGPETDSGRATGGA